MADDTVYGTVAGIIQFPVEERELESGQTVRDATVRSISSGDLVRFTLWPQWADVELERGDFIVGDGKINQRDYKGTTYTDLNPYRLFVGVQEVAREREVEQKSGSGTSKRTF